VDGATEEQGDDLHARLVASFVSSLRTTLDRDQHFWTKEYVEQHLALCDRMEQLGPRGALQVVKLCCGVAEVDIQIAVETVEAIFGP
jgi:hypothetical protein